MTLTSILLAIIVVLALIVLYYRRKLDNYSEASQTWGAVKDTWTTLRGGVLNMVIAENPSKKDIQWVSDNSAHGKGGRMTKTDADVVCKKACETWIDNPSVSVFCNCETGTSVDF